MKTSSLLSTALIAAAVAAASLAGCASPAPPGQCKIRFFLGAADEVNLDREGQSLPTPMTLWLLKDVAPLAQAGFEDIWQNADATLGDAVVDKREVTVFPGTDQKMDVMVPEETAFIAVTAVFRAPEGTGWRTYRKLPPAQTIERCAEGEVGGPLYIKAIGSKLEGSNRRIKTPEKKEAKKEAEASATEKPDGKTDAAPADGGDKKKKKKKK